MWPASTEYWRDEELFGERLCEGFEGLIVAFRELSSADAALEPCNLDEGMVDRRGRLENPLLAVAEHLIPSREDQLTRHQEAGGMDIGLPLHPLLSLAKAADHRGLSWDLKQEGLRRARAIQVPV